MNRRELTTCVVTALLLATLFLVPSAATGQEATYERGETIRVPAPVGFDASQLGRGKPIRGSSFSSIDVAQSHGTLVTVDEDAYDARLRLQRSRFQLNATAEALGLMSGRWRDASQNRYALLRARHISKVKRIDMQGPPPQNSRADYFVSAVYYGWSLNVMIRGRSSTFTRGVAAQLQNVINGGAGGSVEQVTRKNELTTEVKLRGLEPRDSAPAIALTPDAIEQNFRIGTPQPIFVEYTFINDVDSKPIDWRRASMAPGRYRIDKIRIELANRKSRERDWDALGSPPDPNVEMLKDGGSATYLGGQKNTETLQLLPDRSVNLYAGTELTFRVTDEDVDRSDFVGTASLRYDQIQDAQPGQRINLDVTDRIQNAWIILAQEERFGPDPSAQEGRSKPTRIASVYDGPNGLFRIGKPEGWTDQYKAGWTDRGLRHVRLMLSPPSAEKAEMGGYLSEGLRLHLWMPPRGQHTNTNLQRWAPRSIRQMLQANEGFTFTDSSTARIEDAEAIAYTLVGESPAISEPEKTRIIYVARPGYLARIDLVSPARTWKKYEERFEEIVGSFQVTGSPSRP